MYDDLLLDPPSLRSLLVAIFIAFYGLWPLLPGALYMTRAIAWDLRDKGVGSDKMGFCVSVIAFFVLLCLWLLLLIVLSHFVGVFVCTSHDLSTFHGCTPPMNASNVSV